MKKTDIENRMYKQAYLLSIFTIFYNILEGVVSVIMGYTDETLALFGFGMDSFVEVISGVGILVMVRNIRKNTTTTDTKFEIRALKITGTAFYLLCVGLLAGIVVNLINNHKPETTIWGVIISIISILTMIWLMRAKRKVGTILSSEAIIADSNCTRICVYMSVVLLASSLIYELTGFAYADIIGTGGLVYFSASEGKEAFENAKEKMNQLT